MISLSGPPDACATGIAPAALMGRLALGRAVQYDPTHHKFDDVDTEMFIHHGAQSDARLS